MNMVAKPVNHGSLIEPATLKIERLLPGSLEDVWAYLIDSDKRSRWLAAGEMEQRAGATFELVWRNDELTDPPGARPAGFAEENRMACRVIEASPPRRLVFSWGASSEVAIDLSPAGDGVLLTLIHRRLPDRDALLDVSSGWHAHLDVLAAVAGGRRPRPFWDEWLRLRDEYAQRLHG